MNPHDQDAIAHPADQERTIPHLSDRLATPDAGSADPSRSATGPAAGDAQSGHPNWEDGDHSSSDGDHLRKRYPQGVPTPQVVDDLDVTLMAAFQEGDPSKVYEIARQLIDLAHDTVREAAKARFGTNFGTDRCRRCEGLKAGPDVVTTCFQMKQCYFKNFKSDDLTQRHKRALKLFLGS